MNGDRAPLRGALLVVGLAAGGWGLVLVAGLGLADAVALGVWAGAAVVLHDGVVVPLAAAISTAGSRRLPRLLVPRARALLVVLGPLVLLSVPVLGGFGARPDNPTLLDRPYAAGLAAVAALTLVVVALAPRLRRTTG